MPKQAADSVGDSAGDSVGDGAGENAGDGILRTLRRRIASHEFPPGSRVSEIGLSAEFGVSRARIRERFGALEQMGLIERVPNRGAVVVRIDVDRLLDLIDVREVLEGLVARLATENAAPESWRGWMALFEVETAAHVAAGDLDAYLADVERLRDHMIVAADNAVLSDLLDTIDDKTRMVMSRIVALPGRAAQGLEEHQALLGAMGAGDAGAAERLKRENIRSARGFLMRYRNFVV